MTGTSATINGEVNLQFDGETLSQNLSSLPSTPLGGFVSNISGALFTASNRYPGVLAYSGETITARALGPNVTSNGGVARGQLCYWTSENGYAFDIVSGSGLGVGGGAVPEGNTHMLAICLQDLDVGGMGEFLLKGFVSVPDTQSSGFLTLGSSVDGAPLYMDRGNWGYYCDRSGWSGSPGNDIFRCIGYLVSKPSLTTGYFYVIRFDPSTDYIL